MNMRIFAENKMLEVYNAVIKQGKKTPVNDLSLVVADGQCIGAVGSGESATLLFRMLLGLLPLQGGYVSVDGELLTPLSAPYFRQMMTYVPKTVTMPDNRLTLGYLVSLVMKLKAQSDIRWSQERLENIWKEKMGLTHLDFSTRWMDVSLTDRYLVRLSIAMLISKQIVLIDEPEVPLDESTQQLVVSIIQEMKGDDVCMLIATHSPLIQQQCNTIVQI
jgi:ABC-type multidrug transport system ATPase subunit